MEEPIVNKIAIQSTFDGKDAIKGIQDLTKALKNLKGISEDAGFKSINDSLKGMGNALERFVKIGDSQKLKDVVKNLKDISKANNVASKTTEIKNSGSAKKPSTPTGEKPQTIDGEPHEPEKEAKRLSSKFLNSIGRIAAYRAIRAVLATITKSIREGTNEIYEFSKSINGTFAKSFDNIKEKLDVFKGSLGSVASGVIMQFEPVLVRIAEGATNVVNRLAEAFAAMNGENEWLMAVSNADAYTDATDAATDATKRLTKSVFGFDQINKLSSKSSPVSFIKKEVSDQGKTLAGVLKNIKEYAEGIGIALGAWKIGEFVSQLSLSKGLIEGISNVVVTINVKEIFDSIRRIADEGANLNNILQLILGSAGAIFSAIGIATGNPALIAAGATAGVGAIGVEASKDSPFWANAWNEIKSFGSVVGDFFKAPLQKLGLFGGAYATGGFPEDGMFLANHNELVGKFSNGKTAVANNEQIVEGIKEGVYEAQSEQNALLRKQNELLSSILEKTGGEITITGIQRAMTRENRRAGKVVYPMG